MPRDIPSQDVSQAPGGVQGGAHQHLQKRIADALFERQGDVAVDAVLREDPSQPHRGRNDVIDKTLLGIFRLRRADGSFAERADLELLTVSPGESRGPQTALPIPAIPADLSV